MHVENFTSFHSVKKSAKSVKNFIFYDQNRSRGTITSSYYVTRMVVKNVVSNEFSGYIMVPLQTRSLVYNYVILLCCENCRKECGFQPNSSAPNIVILGIKAYIGCFIRQFYENKNLS